MGGPASGGTDPVAVAATGEDGHAATPPSDRIALLNATLADAISRFSEDGLAFSFNGGKDCTVLLPFYASAIVHARNQAKATDGSSQTQPPFLHSVDPLEPKIRAIYFYLPNSFPEVEEFIAKMVHDYNLDLARIPSSNMKDGMIEYLRVNPSIKAIVAGTRKTDPYSGHLTTFSPTDNGWPHFTRVNPIIDWDYTDVWKVMLANQIPYCKLYDLGYTSLGSVDNTIPNPHLKKGDNLYSPAYLLADGSHERDGRLTKKSS